MNLIFSPVSLQHLVVAEDARKATVARSHSHYHTPLSGLTGYRCIPTGIRICGCEPVPGC